MTYRPALRALTLGLMTAFAAAHAGTARLVACGSPSGCISASR